MDRQATHARPSVILEVPERWFRNPDDGARHRALYTSILVALARLGAVVEPRPLPLGADAAPRVAGPGQLVISYHSRGTGANVLRLKESYIPPYYTADPLGYSGFSSLAQTPELYSAAIAGFDLARARASLEDLRQAFRTGHLSKYRQVPAADAALPDHYVFVPLQTESDPIARFRRIDQLDAVGAAARHAARSGGWVVVKRHPLCRGARVAEGLRALAAEHRNLVVSDASVHQLISGAEAVLGGNSGTLFEALVHGRPVVSFGLSDFQAVTAAIDTLDALPAALDGHGAVDPEQRDRFLGWYLHEYCLHAEDVAAIEARIAAALERLDPRGAGGLSRRAQRAVILGHSLVERVRRRLYRRE